MWWETRSPEWVFKLMGKDKNERQPYKEFWEDSSGQK